MTDSPFGEQSPISSTNPVIDMYALVDCNSFFCSVEKVFHPGLEGKPVCVLSNNDGCIVALTPEAKKLGLHRGNPIFKVQHVVRKHGVTIFSTNMQLYAAMSKPGNKTKMSRYVLITSMFHLNLKDNHIFAD